MGVYIPNMDKPKECQGCPIFIWCYTNDWKGYEHCPLIEIDKETEHHILNLWEYAKDMGVNMEQARKDLTVVDLVRCGECKWWDNDGESPYGYCHAEKHCHFSSNWEISIYRKYKADHFCSDGERRNDE